ncbi:type VI secretion system lipoprotein TssJ [Phyllobacterium myrsinacearum]|uniref:Type VI secretion system protein VasD n=1 Tax=Phyllobacterium myrsinacearum TaxID=28101 RepID=A0A839EHI0_9HYPH|nr:type VI secretion system lipoprotein TssJ [Phyllobacterium myrsinacearum]MBA8879733.1 type VI secretion system protein VasD [Phyllobacterium myrsinacearum]
MRFEAFEALTHFCSHSMFQRRVFQAAAVGAGLFLAACTSTPEPSGPKYQDPIPTTVSASATANPSPSGSATPTSVEIFVLKSPGRFQSLDYFQLKGGSALGDDLVERKTVSVRPGQTTELTINPGTEGAYAGVIAGFRDIENARWRALTPISGSSRLSISVGKLSVSASAGH